jgi:hypothetical protein
MMRFSRRSTATSVRTCTVGRSTVCMHDRCGQVDTRMPSCLTCEQQIHSSPALPRDVDERAHALPHQEAGAIRITSLQDSIRARWRGHAGRHPSIFPVAIRRSSSYVARTHAFATHAVVRVPGPPLPPVSRSGDWDGAAQQQEPMQW